MTDAIGQPADRSNRREYGAVFIDLENFFSSRGEFFADQSPSKPYNPSDFVGDLEFLVRWIAESVKDVHLTTLRAYLPNRPFRFSNKQTLFPAETLMELGIEPVLVPPLTFNAKNAIDMRLTMDAISACAGTASARWILLVAGDSDYVPLLLGLRRLGTEVSVIGFAGAKKKPATGKYLKTFASKYWQFEELIHKQENELAEEAIKEKNTSHSDEYVANFYRMALEYQEPRFYLVGVNDWNIITEEIVAVLGNSTPTPEFLVEYLQTNIGAASETRVALRLVVKQLLDSRCFVATDGGEIGNGAEWEQEVKLRPGIESAKGLRKRTQISIIHILRERLTALGISDGLNNHALGLLLFSSISSDALQEVEQLVTSAAKS